MNILIVEDNKSEAHMFSKALEKALVDPVTIHHTATLDDATKQLTRNRGDIDLVFLDLNLPDSPDWRSTYETVAPYADMVPIIVVTGDNDREIAREVLKNGAEDYIVKGGRKRDLETLRETIEFALCRHESTRTLAKTAAQEAQYIHWLTGGYSV